MGRILILCTETKIDKEQGIRIKSIRGYTNKDFVMIYAQTKCLLALFNDGSTAIIDGIFLLDENTEEKVTQVNVSLTSFDNTHGMVRLTRNAAFVEGKFKINSVNRFFSFPHTFVDVGLPTPISTHLARRTLCFCGAIRFKLNDSLDSALIHEKHKPTLRKFEEENLTLKEASTYFSEAKILAVHFGTSAKNIRGVSDA